MGVWTRCAARREGHGRRPRAEWIARQAPDMAFSLSRRAEVERRLAFGTVDRVSRVRKSYRIPSADRVPVSSKHRVPETGLLLFDGRRWGSLAFPLLPRRTPPPMPSAPKGIALADELGDADTISSRALEPAYCRRLLYELLLIRPQLYTAECESAGRNRVDWPTLQPSINLDFSSQSATPPSPQAC